MQFTESPKISELTEVFLKGGNTLIEELWDTPKALIAALASIASGKNILILTAKSSEEQSLYQDLKFFTERQVLDFPAWETLPNENVPPSPDVVGDRYHTLQLLRQAKEPLLVIGSVQACLQRLIPPQKFESLCLTIKKGCSYCFDELSEKLLLMGYRRYPIASDKGEYAIRGGLIDIFPVSSTDPYRIEFFGDEVEGIRTFDPVGQKSIAMQESVSITAAQELEMIHEQKELSTILDYLGDALIIFDDLLQIEDRYASLLGMLGKPTQTFAGLEEWMEEAKKRQAVYLTKEPIEQLSRVALSDGQIGGYYSQSAPMQEITFQMFSTDLTAKRWVSPFFTLDEALISDEDLLKGLAHMPEDIQLRFICQNNGEMQAIQNQIKERALQLPQNVAYLPGYLTSGLYIRDGRLLLFPDTELTGRYRIRRQKMRSTYHTTPVETFHLDTGDIVVHDQHGIGCYRGLEKKKGMDGSESEYFVIEYQERAKLFVPVNQSHLVSKYIGATEQAPTLHKIGSGKWTRVKKQTEKAILGYASDLLDLHAKRELSGGFAYPKDTEEVVQFEREFPFVETEDQLNALAQTKKDMESEKAMDRLVCGDVGYGKTEVAMRAAIKAVLAGGKQVAVLVPTTVLAMQHHDTFCQRMHNYPIRIEVLSRFRTAKQIREALKGAAEGTVDILIGTHRIVSKDVHFKDLGLVVVDEEQRFGVRSKEHLKKIKAGVDCLTLSATPIPRTLYMSLIGVRDMSVIATPPQDRVPIKTVITSKQDEVIRNALYRELSRDGQAFFIHNRIESIDLAASYLQKLLPKARISLAHGGMHADEIDMVFHNFKNGKVDILVCTTIVENGIDIPNANTILIDRADRFGLSELYQLRGRVGRWNRRAYAYFLIDHLRSLSSLSGKRLQALADSSGYGGGMKLAMRDLEIRGAGDLLGTEQSGHVSQIGFHLYCKLLTRAIKALKGMIPAMLTETKMDFPYDARLPDEYVNESSLRLEIYHRFGDALSLDEVDAIWNELKDRFGGPPIPAIWLYRMTRIRAFAASHGFTRLTFNTSTLIAERPSGKVRGVKSIPLKATEDPKELEDITLPALKKVFLL